MGKTHEIKILLGFADDVLSGRKTFEVRKNDRGYQAGDHVIFTVVSENVYDFADCDRHALNSKEYEIKYVLSGWGIKEGFVAFGIKEVKS